MLHVGPSAYSQLVQLPLDGGMGVLFEAGVKQPYETISFARFEFTPPPAPKPKLSQLWSHRKDGTLSTDGKDCLDWAVSGDAAYVTPCDPATFPHRATPRYESSPRLILDPGVLTGLGFRTSKNLCATVLMKTFLC